MPAQKPSGTAQLQVAGLGVVEGLKYSSGVRQYLGIPYGRLSKRWTRATLATSWEGNFHDGTRLGCATF